MSRALTEEIPAGPALRLLRDGLRGSAPQLRRAAAWSLLEAAPAAAAGAVVATALDRGFLAGDAGVGLAWLALLVVLYTLRALAERAVFGPLAETVEPLRDVLVRRVVHGSLHHAVHRTRLVDAAGVSRLTTQCDGVRGITGALLRTARPLVVTLFAASAGLAALEPVLAAIVMPPLVLSVGLFLLVMRSLLRRRLALLLAEEGLAATGGEVLTAGRDITALGAEERAQAEVAGAADAALRASVTVAWGEALRLPVLLLGGYLPMVALLLAGPSLVGQGTVTGGAMVGAVVYLTSYLIPALRMMTGTVAGYWCQMRVLLARLALATAVPSPPAAEPTAAAAPPDGHGLEVRELTFRYGPHADPVLRELDLRIPEGGHLAIVGPSGVGKSTLAGLLSGLERPGGGRVLLGGRPVTDLPEALRCRLVALVPQEAYVFPGTLRENLGYLVPGAEDARLERSVAAVGAQALVHRLGGLDAELADPAGELSGGERQLIALARVHASPALVVVLDEATSQLDMGAEALAERAFAERPGTLVVVAHRLSTAVRARRVLLLDGDRPVSGTHAELLGASPSYAALVGHWNAGAAQEPTVSRTGPAGRTADPAHA
ncbi:ATP-binding cassette domain-containing protein [Streptomyces lonarensis]|uniref:ABC transporter ATP-binding protein n=1 Tax=Streptomyces lonarensis TaxID=700599 RepID=A0A7X6CXQ4_9ACTN|nr:ABC transporter ATP-binding protein [Streptomyces lonarensis]NJQ04487.1 ABC transporter ATP-binding protein [Streptomyces lonarensis]